MNQAGQRKRRHPGNLGVYPNPNLNGILYKKKPRITDTESKEKLSGAMTTCKKALVKVGKVILSPFLLVGFVARKLTGKQRRAQDVTVPVAAGLPYYRPQVNMTGISPFSPNLLDGTLVGDLPLGNRKLRKKENPWQQTGNLPKDIALGKQNKNQKAAKVFAAAKGNLPRISIKALLILFCSMFLAVAVGYGAWFLLEGRYSVVALSDDGKILEVRTADKTVADVLAANNIVLGENDLINCAVDAPLEEGMQIEIYRARSLSVDIGGNRQSIELAAGSTVKDALAKAGYTAKAEDEITPSLDTEIEEGMNIVCVQVESQIVTKTESVAFKTVRKNSSSLYKGTTKVSQQGKNGVRTIQERVIYKNGEEASRSVISNEITTAPQNKIILVGTKKKASSGGSSNIPSNLPSGYPSASQIKKTFVSETITAYSGGGRTATGKKPRVGMCAVNPKLIPYGTRLYIPGYGYAVAEDTGGFVKKYPTGIDVYMSSDSACRQWGRKRNVTVYILK